MDAEDVDHRTRMRTGCIPPELVAHLVEAGHTAEVERQAGRTEEALAVLDRDAPDLHRDRAALLIDLGRVGDAVELLQRPVPEPVWPAPNGLADGPADEPPF